MKLFKIMNQYYYFIKKDNKIIRIATFDVKVNTNINHNMIELTNEQIEFYLEHPYASIIEIQNCALWAQPEPVDMLEQAKAQKQEEIDAYDTSENVNGFFYNEVFMWLDRKTRATLRNTIDSLKIFGRETLNIWYNEINITLSVQEAEYLLAALEVYATDCYNVTATHKNYVNNLTNIEDVNAFDVTADYPQRLHF